MWVMSKEGDVVPLDSYENITSTVISAPTKETAETMFKELAKIHKEHPGGIIAKLMEIPFND